MPPLKRRQRQPDPASVAGERFRSLLSRRCEDVVRLTSNQVEALSLHWALYQRWNRALNLSAIRDPETAVDRHYCESLFLGACLPPEPLRIVDVGSGAGFPGFPIAVLRGDCHVALVESHQRKAAFLKEVARGLPNITVFAARASELHEHFDWLVSRAVSWEDLEQDAMRLADHIALLVSAAGARALAVAGRPRWRDPRPLPWGDHGAVLVAHVPRGTS